jgi:hypothetical protein
MSVFELLTHIFFKKKIIGAWYFKTAVPWLPWRNVLTFSHELI